MANPRINYDVDEIDEIIKLYIKKQAELGHIITKYGSSTLSKFNQKLVDDNIKRENGKSFKLYKYHFWAGKQPNGEYNYGKKKIIELNEELKTELVGDVEAPELNDIILIVNKNYKNPQKLIKLLSVYFFKQDTKIKNLLGENLKLVEQNNKLVNKSKHLEDGITRIMFDSQSAHNSLSNMFNLEKSQDSFILEELNYMFDNDLSKLERLTNIGSSNTQTNENSSLSNVIEIQKQKLKAKKQQKFEEDGF